ncbi:MAG: hypothetical protein P8M22_05930 [Phycisphaerales bacterium]|nr:hypothetical protein [Phycisphaerales bacterium]
MTMWGLTRSGIVAGLGLALLPHVVSAAALPPKDDDGCAGCEPMTCLRMAPVQLGLISAAELPEHPAIARPDGWSRRGASRSWQGEIYNSQPVQGTYRIPVVAFGYSNVALPDGVQEALQQVLGAEPPNESLRSYYLEMSNGVFEIIPEIYIVEALPNTDLYYENESRGWGAESRELLLSDLIPMLDGQIDFGRYDNDGPDGIPNSGDDDGRVDSMMLFTPEPYGSDLDNIFAHAWDASAAFPPEGFVTGDQSANGGSIKIGKGCTQSCVGLFGDVEIRLGTCAHEIGHCLGLPDLYDVEQHADEDDDPWRGTGMFCLMSSSAPLKNLSAWCKLKLGWVEVTRLNGLNEMLVEFPAVNNSYRIFKIDLNVTGTEYFLLEYRLNLAPFEGINGQGIAIYHIDERKSNNRVPNCSGIGPLHSLVHVEEADGSCNLGNNQEPCICAWWGWQDASPRFAADSTPHSLRWDGVDIGIEIRDFSDAWPPSPEGFMTAVVTAPEPPQDEVIPTGLDIVWTFDVSGSYEDDLENMSEQVLGALDDIEEWYPRARHALIFFVDFPWAPWGAEFDNVYFVLENFTRNPQRIKDWIAGLQIFNGGDHPECQYEVLHQIITGEGRDWNQDGVHLPSQGEMIPYQLDWEPSHTAAIIMMTDAPFHDSDHEPNYPLPAPNNAAGESDVIHDLNVAPNLPIGKTPHIFILDAVDDEVPTFDDSGVPTYEPTVLQQQAETLAQWSNGAYIPAGKDTVLFRQAVRKALHLMVQADPMGGACIFEGSTGDPFCESNRTQAQCLDLDGAFLPFSTSCEEDCDSNGTMDLWEILVGEQIGADVDINDNGILDSCECLGDLDFDNDVDIDDLLKIVSYWGECSGGDPCDSDFDSNWHTDIQDLLFVLSRWGDCQGCAAGEITDCNDHCAPELWLGDGFCDDGTSTFGIDFNCVEFGFDGGDCVDCFESEIPDCNGNCAPATWLGDGFCDDGDYEYNGFWIDFNCEPLDFDNGDCAP